MKSAMYEQDFLLWTEQQANAIRTNNLAALDKEGLLEELESMGNSERKALKSALRNVLAHLLKFQFSSAEAPRAGWIDEIQRFREDIEFQLDDEPSLKHYIDNLFLSAWPQAKSSAERSFSKYKETPAVLPKNCPYSLAQVMNFDYLPERA